MPRTKDTKTLRLYVSLPEMKKAQPLYINKAGLPSMANFVSLKKPGSEKPHLNKPKPPGASMGHSPKKPDISGLNSRGRAALDAMPDKAMKFEEDDEGDE